MGDESQTPISQMTEKQKLISISMKIYTHSRSPSASITMRPLQEKSSEMESPTGGKLVHAEHICRNIEPTTLHLPLSPHEIRRLTPSTPPGDDPSIEAIPPMPMLAKTTEGHTCEPIACPRRSIFGGINNSYPRKYISPTQSPRHVIDLNRFTPSPKFLQESGDRYTPVAQLPTSYSFLPTLPTPFTRFYLDDGSAKYLPGTYPTKKQPSILRLSSYCTRPKAVDEGQQPDEPENSEIRFDSLKLTSPGRLYPKDSSITCNDADTVPSTPSQSSWEECHHVQFDPRITVIAFKNDFQRQWISEDELARLKEETVSLAHDYLRQHPELIEKYMTPMKDFVTCTLRRRALYSLPVMSHCSDDDDDDGGDNPHDDDKGNEKTE